MHDSDRLSVEELVQYYNNKKSCRANIEILEGGKTVKYLIKTVAPSKTSHKVVYDPERKLRVGQYIDSYYCNTWQELNEIIEYLFNESLLFSQEEQSLDVLDQPDTKRYFYLDDIFDM